MDKTVALDLPVGFVLFNRKKMNDKNVHIFAEVEINEQNDVCL